MSWSIRSLAVSLPFASFEARRSTYPTISGTESEGDSRNARSAFLERLGRRVGAPAWEGSRNAILRLRSSARSLESIQARPRATVCSQIGEVFVGGHSQPPTNPPGPRPIQPESEWPE